MTDEFFDIAFEGTCFEDCLTLRLVPQENIIVFDTKLEYGSTYSSIDQLKRYEYVEHVIIRKWSGDISIEVYPDILKYKGKNIDLNELKETLTFCKYTELKSHFLILESGEYYKIPYTKSDTVESTFLTLKDKNILYKYLNNNIDTKYLQDLLSDNSKQILMNGLNEDILNEYKLNYGVCPFYYPKYGFKDIVEGMCRINAINGVSYVLDDTLQLFEIQNIKSEEFKYNESHKDDKLIFKNITLNKPENVGDISELGISNLNNIISQGYKFYMKSQYGNIYTKKLYKKVVTGDKLYIRIISTTVNPLLHNFFAYLYNGTCCIKIYALDSKSKCCKDGEFLIYFVSKVSEIHDNVLAILRIEESTIRNDISFQTLLTKHVEY